MNWYTPWDYTSQVDEIVPLQLLNMALPQMSNNQRAQAARYLYQQRTQDPDLTSWMQNYNVAGPGADSTNSWLRSLQGMGGVKAPSYYSAGPQEDWFQGLQQLGRSMGPNATRQQQTNWNTSMPQMLANAPNDMMKGIGQAMYMPTLTRPEYGSAPLMANYTQNYSKKGGLVSNPWFAT